MAGTDETADAGTPPAPAPQKATRKPKKAAAPDPEALAAEIEKTREELAETLDAIAEKVSPKRVAKRTTKKVADAVKETASDAATAVKSGASDAASAVKDGATSAREKVAGTTAAEPEVTAPQVVEAVPAVAAHPAPTPFRPVVAPPATPSLVRPEYVAAGAAAALVAWLLIRRR